jgi:hypothetical protein
MKVKTHVSFIAESLVRCGAKMLPPNATHAGSDRSVYNILNDHPSIRRRFKKSQVSIDQICDANGKLVDTDVLKADISLGLALKRRVGALTRQRLETVLPQVYKQPLTRFIDCTDEQFNGSRALFENNDCIANNAAASWAADVPLTVYTDGSYDNGVATYGLYIPDLNIIEGGRVIGEQSSLHGESTGLRRSTDLTRAFKRVRYLTDCAVLEDLVLKLCRSRSTSARNILFRDDIRHIIDVNDKHHGRNNWTLEHVYAHWIIEGNNLADSAAELAHTLPPYVSPFAHLDAKSLPDEYSIVLNGLPISRAVRQTVQSCAQ